MNTSLSNKARRLREHALEGVTDAQRRLLLNLGRLAAELDIQLQGRGVDAVSQRDGRVGSIVGARRAPDDTNDGVVILRFQSRLGHGERLIAVPFSCASMNQSDDRCTLSVDRQSLENAPPLDLEDERTLRDPAWFAAIRDYYDGAG